MCPLGGLYCSGGCIGVVSVCCRLGRHLHAGKVEPMINNVNLILRSKWSGMAKINTLFMEREFDITPLVVLRTLI